MFQRASREDHHGGLINNSYNILDTYYQVLTTIVSCPYPKGSPLV